jgi:hypothetical protein
MDERRILEGMALGCDRRLLPLWSSLLAVLPGIAVAWPAAGVASPRIDLVDLASDAPGSEPVLSQTRSFRDIVSFPEWIELTTSRHEENSEESVDVPADQAPALVADEFGYELSQEILSDSPGPVLAANPDESVAEHTTVPQPKVQNSQAKAEVTIVPGFVDEAPEDGNGEAVYLADDLLSGDLEWSRQKFRELLESSETSLARLDPRFLGGLADTQLLSVDELRIRDMGLQSSAALAQESPQAGKPFDPRKTYTVVNGKIVEVHQTESVTEGPMSPVASAPVGAAPSVTAPIVVSQNPVQPEPSASPRVSSPSAGKAGQPLLDSAPLTQSLTAVYLTDRQDSAVQSGATMRALESGNETAQGAFVRGRVEVPPGISTSSVIVRIAGTAVETYLDSDGFFELGPLSLGSSVNLLIFDLDSRLNRRIVPVFVGLKAPEKQIRLIRSSDALDLARSFGAQLPLNRSGFCGTVSGTLIEAGVESEGDAQSNEGNDSSSASRGTEVFLVDPAGQRQALHFYGPSGLPSESTTLTRDGRLCAFDLGEGVHRLFVKTQNTRRAFSISLRNSEFENNLRFDLLPKTYVKVKAFTLVDQELFGEMVSRSSDQAELTPIQLNSPRQDMWVSGQTKAVWAPVSDYEIVTDPAYAAVTVFNDSEKRYMPTAEDLVEVSEGDSRSTALIGADVISRLADDKAPLSLHVLARDTVEEIRSYFDIPAGSSDFLVFGELDTAQFLRGEGPFQVVMTDIWTALPVGTVRVMSSAQDRILRFAGGNLDSGVFQIGVYNTQGRLVWSSIVRAEKGTHQVLSNRN